MNSPSSVGSFPVTVHEVGLIKKRRIQRLFRSRRVDIQAELEQDVRQDELIDHMADDVSNSSCHLIKDPHHLQDVNSQCDTLADTLCDNFAASSRQIVDPPDQSLNGCREAKKQEMKQQYQRIISIQSLIRRHLAIQHLSKLQKEHRIRNQAIILIQSCYRCYSQRMKYRGIISGTLLYQRAARGVSMQQFCRDYSTRLKVAAQYNQKSYGPDDECDAEWENHSESRHSSANQQSSYPRKGSFLAMKLQALYRGHVSRKLSAHGTALGAIEANAATIIQSLWRTYSCRTAYTLKMRNIVIVQSLLRRWIVLRRLRERDVIMEGNILELEKTANDHFSRCEFIEDLAIWYKDFDFEEEVRELIMSFEEEMSELQIRFSQGAAFELW